MHADCQKGVFQEWVWILSRNFCKNNKNLGLQFSTKNAFICIYVTFGSIGWQIKKNAGKKFAQKYTKNVWHQTAYEMKLSFEGIVGAGNEKVFNIIIFMDIKCFKI